MKPIEALKQRLCREAEKLQWPVKEAPSELLHTQISLSSKSQKMGSQTDRPEIEMTAMYVGDYAVLIGPLENRQPNFATSESDRSVLDAYYRRAAIARTCLPNDRCEDLILFLVGPSGSDTDPDWKADAAQIERNDAVCRKIVWLPPSQETTWDASLDRFQRRTFLARPWADSGTLQTALDALAGTDKSLHAWGPILDAAPSDVNYDDLVEKLIESFIPKAPNNE
jgi:hypothetical protein